jgi:hypothetical protein
MFARAIRPFAITAACILICLSTACTTLSPVATDATGERIRSEVKAGDTVRVLTADGTTHSFQVTAVGLSSLAGNAAKTPRGGTDVPGSQIELPYRDIRQIDVRRVSIFKTAAIVAAVALLAAIAIASGGGSHTPGFTR